MQPKPKHLETAYAEQFKDASVVHAYHCRPPYPDAMFPFLAELVKGEPKIVLDVGCGLGNIARPLSRYVDRVDGVDFSEPMIAQGKQLPDGDAPNLYWICSPIENAALTPPYGLITAGQSLHWFDWPVALPRFAELLVPGGFLVIVNRIFRQTAWSTKLLQLIAQFSTNRDYQSYNLYDELGKRQLFSKQGEKMIEPQTFTQTIDDYIEAIHSSNGFSRDRMQPEKAQAFDDAVRELLWSYVGVKRFETAVSTHIVWGFPQRLTLYNNEVLS
ncbi:MAG: methyltransferase domain-containing protein [Anaerolineae bacterium]|nr:methyltransferase domain-containing protein [Anaerolineae bacterium]